MPRAKRCFSSFGRTRLNHTIGAEWRLAHGDCPMTPRTLLRSASLLALAAFAFSAAPAQALEKIRFGLNWLPEGEHCGFFQAKAAGLYEKAGLDVELRSGGPDQNVAILVASGQETIGLG